MTPNLLLPSRSPQAGTAGPVPRSSAELPRAHRAPALELCAGSYRLRFARTEADLDAVRRLRFEVFNLELGEGLPESYLTGRDEDGYDLQCQHLLVEHRTSGTCVGTYRMQTMEDACSGLGWYSAGEFDLSGIPEQAQAGLAELGRACVQRQHRDRRVLFLLWQGLIAFARQNRCLGLFGCSSLSGRDPAVAQRFAAQLEQAGRLDRDWRVTPWPQFACRAAPEAVARVPEVATPRLFASYLRYGGTILGPPALDSTFGTLDFLTLVRLDPVLLRRFGTSSPRP